MTKRIDFTDEERAEFDRIYSLGRSGRHSRLVWRNGRWGPDIADEKAA